MELLAPARTNILVFITYIAQFNEYFEKEMAPKLSLFLIDTLVKMQSTTVIIKKVVSSKDNLILNHAVPTPMEHNIVN